MEILKVENLCKRYGEKDTEVVALDNVSFTCLLYTSDAADE